MYKTPQPILQRIEEAAISQAEALDLSNIIENYRAPQLPPEVLQLSRLKRLICHNQALSILPQALSELMQLESVDIRHNPIRQLSPDHPPLIIDSLQWQHLKTQLKLERIVGMQIRPADRDQLEQIVRQLPQLRWLSLSNCKFHVLPREVELLKQLTILDLSYNKLQSLQGIETLNQLTALDLNGNKLQSLQGIDTLNQLTALGLSCNGLRSLQGIDSLNQLTVLGLSSDGLQSLQGIETLNQLTTLDLSGNKLQSLQGVGTLKQLTTLDISNNFLQSLQGIETLSRLTTLDISNNFLQSLQGIETLSRLTTLDISNNELQQSLQGIETLNQLTTLNIRSNGLQSLQGIDTLKQLTMLDISGNKLQSLQGIETLSQLTTLDLSNNGLRSLQGIETLNQLTTPDLRHNELQSLQGIETLSQLTTLNFCNNRLRSLQDIETLSQLTTLDLRYNELQSLQGIETLNQLTTLNIRSNGLQSLQGIDTLNQLTTLDISGNKLPSLQGIDTLKQLTMLDISGNELQSLQGIEILSQLTTLDLSNNGLCSLQGIEILDRLTRLDLCDNNLQSLQGIEALDYLYFLSLGNNPLDNATQAAAEENPQALLRHLHNIDQGLRVYEAKLLVVGAPAAGKTSLSKMLRQPGYTVPCEENSTLGIQVYENWCFPWCKDAAINFCANIWDFGGQEIQYATHQFFLTQRAVYVLVADNRRQETDYDYWFKIIRLLGKQSPVLIFLHDKEGRVVTDFNEAEYRKRYKEIPFEVIHADLADNRCGHVDALRTKIEQMLSNLDHVGDKLPKAWPEIRRQIEARKTEHHMSYGELAKLCRNHGLDQDSDVCVMARYLGWLGVIVYFENDPVLQDFIIIDPEWALNALYAVLQRDEVQNRGGRLERDFFFQVLRENGNYREDEINKLLNLLTEDKFEICYKLEGSEGQTYIVPQLLPTITPSYAWDGKENLRFEYQYPFMPKGLIARFIIRLNEYIETDENNQQIVWNSGVVLNRNGIRAEIKEDEDATSGGKIITIRIVGSVSERVEFLTIIRYEIEQTHRRISENLIAHPRIPCCCGECIESDTPHMHPFNRIKSRVDKDKTTIDCGKSEEPVAIVQLLKGVTEKKIPSLSDGYINQLAEQNLNNDNLMELLRLALSKNIHIDVSQSQTTTVDIAIEIQVKNEACFELSGLLKNLISEAGKQLTKEQATQLNAVLNEADEKLAQLEGATSKERKYRGPMTALKGLVDKLSDTTDTTGKLIRTLEKGTEQAGKVAGLYNKIEPFFRNFPM